MKSYKGITAPPNVEAGLEEGQEYLEAGFPIYAAVDDGDYIGYMVCRIEEPCVWVESIFVEESHRGFNVAFLLLECAERIADSYGENTLDIDCLSTGCKTTLNVLYFPEKVFCMKECGDNALSIIYALEHGSVYSDYATIPFDMDAVFVCSGTEIRTISDYEELKEWWDYEE